ncbi:DoxX family protein [Mucilaginibacter sp. Bleaf8]|uniref:DoxX family protein n=1 Tax=Mucilaginibacter sp. Bleaf8 TaxID=2834430 RepID=UPI001BCD8404|nr:DoxX family protein [Mucilaginibacter sp. Bleaf8]MBS7566495.1 DoxX family protein [Mucilaginibacter sp. Bleaf8]
MNLNCNLDRLHSKAKRNRWLHGFAIFNRIGLAAGFLPSGFVKIMGERFTALSVNHPMGHYLEALHVTGYYYTFIGIAQVTAAVLLLIPRTATLGALLYFPIILNICILSLAVRFDGSLLSSPLMVLANLYLLCWDYDKLKPILPFSKPAIQNNLPRQNEMDNKFPTKFFAGVAATVILLALIIFNMYDIRPRNTLKDCTQQCETSDNPNACRVFCDCIHKQGQSLDQSLDNYHKALKVAHR